MYIGKTSLLYCTSLETKESNDSSGGTKVESLRNEEDEKFALRHKFPSPFLFKNQLEVKFRTFRGVFDFRCSLFSNSWLLASSKTNQFQHFSFSVILWFFTWSVSKIARLIYYCKAFYFEWSFFFLSLFIFIAPIAKLFSTEILIVSVSLFSQQIQFSF